MKHQNALVRLITMLSLITAVWLTACGGGPTPPAQPQPTPTPPTTGNTASTGGAMKDLVLKLGRIPFTNSSGLMRASEELLKYLSQELGVKEVRLITGSDYHSLITKLEREEIDIGWLGSLSYVEAAQRLKLKPLVKPTRFDTNSYRGLIITRQDSGIKSLADLKGKKFAWVEKESASGYTFPKALLIEAGINPDKDFAEAAFLQKHDAVVLNVLIGKYDAGACYDDARNTLRDKEKINDLTVLARTEDISNEPIVCRAGLPEDLVEKIRKAFLKLDFNNPAHKKVLDELTDVRGFVPASDADYNYVRKVCELLTTHDGAKPQ
ncbi:MAG TPA: phosphate/phosphite/phosphonate ABC transporter substrate-binding protein [Candidatus Ozemobacteraceae bacterium]|nr:phosphate/phosphite/phosphonate ABC transporter substrate-binding protein [Candidatus Ozemobacteraceae bacterium]